MRVTLGLLDNGKNGNYYLGFVNLSKVMQTPDE